MSADQQKAVPNPHITALTENHIDNPDYTPARLLDEILVRFRLKNDAALARVLQLPPSVVSKIRSKKTSITSGLLIRLHDVTGWAIGDLRALMGIKSQFVAL